MGVVILQEVERCSDERLRHALRFLAAFGLLHGFHEWLDMFTTMAPIPVSLAYWWETGRIILLAISFLPLAEFGASLLSPTRDVRRLSLLVPLTLAFLWAMGIVSMDGRYSMGGEFWDVADVWTRYTLAIPGAMLACAGLVFQQRAFRQVGMAQFGRDSLWAAISFVWYGMVGQLFARPSSLPPSTFLNSILFQQVFGFPVEIMRAVAAVFAAVFVIRFLRSFEVETQHMISELQQARLDELQRREALRGELLRRVVAAQEAERQRIARELHDETGQALTAIGLGLRGVSISLKTDADKAANNLRQLEGLVDHSLNELQRVIADLRPSHLDDLGLAATLRWYCNEVEERAGIKINVEFIGEPREISAEVKTACFRIAQEALTNVVRHAKATAAHVQLQYTAEFVSIIVEDDGCGFEVPNVKTEKNAAWGLLGMEERASLLGGTLLLQSEPGKGTRVVANIPYLFHIKEEKHDHTINIGG